MNRSVERPSSLRVGFLSLGCPKNLVDSEVMMGLVEQAGHTLTPEATEADVLVVNTCAFIDKAKEESVEAILEMARHKTEGRCRRLVVTGCLAERYRDELMAQIPEIDAVLGTGDVPGIVGAVVPGPPTVRPPDVVAGAPVRFYRNQAGRSGAVLPEPSEPPRVLPTYLYDADTPRHLTTPRHFAYVKVAEGCDYTCAFCIIPTLRGEYRSRPAASVVREAEALAARDVKELILISQDTSFYGVDRRERGALARLLRALNRIDGLIWIRLLYLYPTTIDDETLEAMAECEKVCKYVDLPLQHASASVLARMKRPGHGDRYRALLDRIRAKVPGVALRTTFIVGFPGETDEEFGELLAFVRAVEFDHVGVFTYSHEEGTSAHSLPDSVPAAEKQRRRRRLLTLQRGIVSKAQKRRVGQRVQVLIDGPSPEHELVVQGRLEGHAHDIDRVVYLTESDPSELVPGTLVEATIVASRGYDLVARPLPVAVSLCYSK